MKPDATGSVIDLCWGDDAATVWYVRGHVSDAEALAAVRGLLEDEVEEGERDHVPALRCTGHGYARWGVGVVVGVGHALRVGGPGAFAVTEVVDVDHLDAIRKAREVTP